MARKGRGVEQFSVRIYFGPDPIATFVLSAQESQIMVEALDGSKEDVDSMLVALLLTMIASIKMLPQRWVLLDCAAVIDKLLERLVAEMEDEDEPDLPF
jgi:hypothetical protein